jgi:hypothetical protein
MLCDAKGLYSAAIFIIDGAKMYKAKLTGVEVDSDEIFAKAHADEEPQRTAAHQQAPGTAGSFSPAFRAGASGVRRAKAYELPRCAAFIGASSPGDRRCNCAPSST